MLFSCATSAMASLYVYEPYPTQGANTYTANTSLSATANQNVPASAGAWTGPISGSTGYSVSSSGLQYAGLATAGGSISTVPFATNTRPFSATNVTSTTFFSFLLNFTTFDNTMIVGLANAGGSVVSGINVVSAGELFARSNVLNSDSSIALTLNTTYLVVGQADVTAGSNVNVSIWLNPNLTSPGAADLTAPGSSTGIGMAQWYSFQTASTPEYSFDEFRVGTTWEDVTPVPEPSTIWAILLGLTFLVVARSRSRKLEN